jgi:hypothetical protein
VTAEITSLIWVGATSARQSAVTVERSWAAASCNSRLLRALAMSRRRTNGERVSAATRSIATITPRISERGEKTTTCRTS